jgi:hypothetical protein
VTLALGRLGGLTCIWRRDAGDSAASRAIVVESVWRTDNRPCVAHARRITSTPPKLDTALRVRLAALSERPVRSTSINDDTSGSPYRLLRRRQNKEQTSVNDV